MNFTRRSTLKGMVAATTALAAPAKLFAQTSEINVALFGHPYNNGLQKLAGEFEAQTGIRANIDVVGQDVFESRINLSFTGGTGEIDVVHTPAIQYQKWVSAGWLLPMTNYLPEMAGLNDILAGPLDTYRLKGENWGMPFGAGTGLMTYRKDLLDAAGKSAPDTWEDMLDVAAAVNSDDVAAVALRAAPGQGFNMFIFPMIMRAYGGKFFADYVNGDLTPAINSPENLEALKIYIKLLNDFGPQGVGTYNFAEIVAGMQAGKLAMTVEGTGIVSQLIDPSKSKFAEQMGIALPPKGPVGRSPAIAVHGLGIPASSRNPDAAAKFISWATSTETVRKITLSEPFIDFVNKPLTTDTDVMAKYGAAQPDLLKLKADALDLAIGHYRPLVPKWGEIGSSVGENVNGALNGLSTPEEALELAQDEMNSIMGL
ncbi:sugar ABC transporter substrate-binding protein [Pseudorhodobacter sp. W20_MBD10_FR17]|uniref:ABC transporter substrate-binding protein n=1 Tax=Pseudorhodobacter sp. W20_MBD10_FR17 TaxID=3240266 RepID=UPI003F9625CD